MAEERARLEILLELVDNATEGVKKAFEGVNKASQSMASGLKNAVKNAEDFGKSLYQAGRQLSQISRNLMMLGAMLSGPLVLAFKTASNYSAEANNVWKQMSNALTQLQVSIGTAIIPIMQRIANVINNVVKWFDGLSESMRNSVIQTAFVVSAIMVLVGPFGSAIGRILQIIGAVVKFGAAHPILMLVVGAILALILAWEKVKDVVIPIINVIQIAITRLAQGLLIAISGMLEGLQFFINKLQTVAEWGARLHIPGFEKIAESIRNVNLNIDGFQEKIRIACEQASLDIEALSRNISDPGKMASAIDGVITKTKGLIDTFKKIGEEGASIGLKQFTLDFNKTILDAKKQIPTLGQAFGTMVVTSVQTFSSGFGRAIGDMILNGKKFGESMKELFKEMAMQFIQYVIQMIVQWLIFTALTGGGGGFFGGLFHKGGAVKRHRGGLVRAHDGLAVDEVPIIAQRGEGILSRRGMGSIGGERGLDRINQGDMPSGAITVNIESASFRREEDVDEFFSRFSDLINRKGRAKI